MSDVRIGPVTDEPRAARPEHALAPGHLTVLAELIQEYCDHQSVRCGWPEAYGQWVDGDCACGLTQALRDAGLPVAWAGGPPK